MYKNSAGGGPPRANQKKMTTTRSMKRNLQADNTERVCVKRRAAEAEALAAARAEDAARAAAEAESLVVAARILEQNRAAYRAHAEAREARLALVPCSAPAHDNPCCNCQLEERCTYLPHPEGEVCCCCFGETGTIEARCDDCRMFTCDNCHYTELGCMCPVCDREELNEVEECVHCLRLVRSGQFSTLPCSVAGCIDANHQSCWDCRRSQFSHYTHSGEDGYPKSNDDRAECPLVHDLENADGWAGFWATKCARILAAAKVTAWKHRQALTVRAKLVDARHAAALDKARRRGLAASRRWLDLCDLAVQRAAAWAEGAAGAQELYAAAAAAREAGREEAEAEAARATALEAAVDAAAQQRGAHAAEATAAQEARIQACIVRTTNRGAATVAREMPAVAARVVAAWATAQAAPEGKARVVATWAALIARVDARDAAAIPKKSLLAARGAWERPLA